MPAVHDKLELVELDSEDADAFSPGEDIFARVCRWASEWMTVGLVVMMGAEMIVRSLFGWSIQFSNEVGGYALVAITFLALGSGQLLHAYHRVHFVESKLSPLGRARLRLVLDLGSTFVALVLLYVMIRFEWTSWNSGDVAATDIQTPLWVPRLALPIGMLVLSIAMVRTLVADWARIRSENLRSEKLRSENNNRKT